MRLIFIRHAEPDYINNTLTEKGFREAEILKPRVLKWKVDRFYTSPLPRARLTAKPALDALNREATIIPWIQEFYYPITDPTTGKKEQVPWDFMPEYWTKRDRFYDRNRWYEDDIFRTNPDYEPAVMNLRQGLDDILRDYGYTRDGGMYLADPEKTRDDDETTVVFFAHLGANMEAVGYLLGISPIVLQQTVYLAPTSVTILNAEKRREGKAMFRAQCIGDVSHLLAAGEPVSAFGAFSGIHQF